MLMLNKNYLLVMLSSVAHCNTTNSYQNSRDDSEKRGCNGDRAACITTIASRITYIATSATPSAIATSIATITSITAIAAVTTITTITSTGSLDRVIEFVYTCTSGSK